MIDIATVKINDRVISPAGEGLIGGRYVNRDGQEFVIVSVMKPRKDASVKGMWDLYYCKPEDCEVVK